MRAPDLELLWWEGCPSTERALAELREALSDVGLDQAEVRTREIETDDRGRPGGLSRLADDPDRRRRHRGRVPRRPRRARLPRLPPPRRPHQPDPGPRRSARRRYGEPPEARRSRPDDDCDRRQRARSSTCPTPTGRRWSSADGGSPTVVVFTCNHCPYALAWHDRIAAGGARLRRPRRALPGDQLQRRHAPPATTPTRRCRQARGLGGLADALPLRRRPRMWRARTAPRPLPTCSCSTARAGCATAARPTPTTRTRASGRRGCATPSTRCSPARTPDQAETKPVGCSIKWKP